MCVCVGGWVDGCVHTFVHAFHRNPQIIFPVNSPPYVLVTISIVAKEIVTECLQFLMIPSC